MKILIDIGHPAHIHLFKNFAFYLLKHGSDILFTTRNKEVTVELLQIYNLPYKSFGKHYHSLLKKLYGLIKFDTMLYKVSRQFKPDIYMSAGSIYAAQCAWLDGKPHLSFEDTGNNEQVWLYKPFTEVILTPDSFNKGDYGSKQVKYRGYHEIAYLHPKYYKPDKGIFKKLNINEHERYVLARFVGSNASHDFRYKGMKTHEKINLIRMISNYAKVFITSEKELPVELLNYQINISPDQMHNAIAFATLYIGEGATMAMESILLGIPTIYINPIVFNQFEEIHKNYNLVWISHNYEQIKELTIKILTDDSYSCMCKSKYKELINDKIDVTAFMIWFVENYPDSFKIMKANPDYQDRFK